MKIFSFFLITVLLLSGCTTGGSEHIYYNKDIVESLRIATQKEKFFCVVLTDSREKASRTFLSALRKDYGYLTKKSVFNIVDLNSLENHWYVKWLLPISVPLTCVFTQDGSLIDIIPGYAKESFLYIDKAIQEEKITEYHWPNRFHKEKRNLIPTLSKLIDIKIKGAEVFTSEEYRAISDSLDYPYSNFLIYQRVKDGQDNVLSKLISRRFFSKESSETLELYKDEFIEMKRMTDPDFNLENSPKIRIDNNNIELDGLKIGESIPLDIKVWNDGKEPLIIEKIDMSCSCLRLDGKDSDVIVEEGKSKNFKFYFTPENEGIVTRNIFFASNALNKPNLNISIKGIVKK